MKPLEKEQLEAIIEAIEGGYLATLKDFKQNLKERGLIEEQLEERKWNLSEVGILIYVQSVNNNIITGYGFGRSGRWNASHTDWIHYGNYKIRPATRKEISTALIKEAKKKYPKGTLFTNLFNKSQRDISSGEFELLDTGELVCLSCRSVVFNDTGKWADIVQKKVEDVGITITIVTY